MRRGRAAVVGLVVAAALLSRQSPARACSGSDCYAPTLVPASDGVQMPINAVGVAWYTYEHDSAAVELVDVQADVSLPFTVVDAGTFDALVPVGPLEVDREYRFVVPDEFCGSGSSRRFVISPAVELPTELGHLVASAPMLSMVPVAESVVCTGSIDAVVVDVELELAPTAAPFADVLMFQTLLDGEPWKHEPSLFPPLQFGESWFGRGVDRLFASCSGSQDGAPDVHTVQMIAQIPGAPDVVLASDEVEIDLACPVEGTTGDEQADGESGSFVVPIDNRDNASGCACTVTREHTGSLASGLLVLALCVRRRRR